MSGRWRVRVDTGGTFTDAWGCSPGGDEGRCKVLSDGRMRLRLGPADEAGRQRIESGMRLGDGFLEGWRTEDSGVVIEHRDGRLRLAAPVEGVVELGSGEEAPVVAARLLTGTPLTCELPEMDFRVATTRGTNALLERKGARLAFFVTEGFEDLLEIRDQRRERLFELAQPEPVRLAERVVGVTGRLTAAGEELEPLDEAAVKAAAAEALRAGCDAVAVALLNAWANPEHERRVGSLLREVGFSEISLSTVVAPVIRLLPRAETAVTDAFLGPVLRRFVERVSAPLRGREPWLMTSAGGLVPAGRYQPKDSLLSGPAGGLIGAAELGRAAGFPKLLTFDMGGTSTDVARVDGTLSFRQEQQIGPARVVAPALKIETVAAGGGSICRWRDGRLEVGPESAGSDPGPACYGRGGPLTVTDVNLLLGLMDPARAGIPLDRAAAGARLAELREAMARDGGEAPEERALLEGLRAIAVEKMAEAIRAVSVREGVTVEDHALLAFGGAGPQHACAVADRLGVAAVLVPADAGLLSAWGLERAVRQEIGLRQVLRGLDEVASDLARVWRELGDEAAAKLGAAPRFRWLADLRLRGQDASLEVELREPGVAGLREGFAAAYRRVFGYAPAAERELELVALRVVAEEAGDPVAAEVFGDDGENGPQLLQDAFATCVVPQGWRMRRGSRGTLLIEKMTDAREAELKEPAAAVRSGLFRSRFEGLLDAMGEALRRTALSTNVKERLDFSCALLDAEGRLVASAPHVPVHLGALGVCVREVAARLELGAGDVAITNHPGAGGSHLPDVTLIAPVFDAAVGLIGYVANRAHHAEIGGKAPGSMPADARSLVEEGVVIPPMKLVEGGEPRWERVERLLRESPYPSRRPADNLADLEAQLAACHFAREALGELADRHGAAVVAEELRDIVEGSAKAMRRRLAAGFPTGRVETALDDGSPLVAELREEGGRWVIDFEGTAEVRPDNLNATPAIVRSVVLYALRLWIGEDLPLNEGLLEPVDLRIPRSFLNPVFSENPIDAPAVVGGNVELSQRVADLLLEALGLAANGPGTMNNFLFGDDRFGYYETLAGGGGAGPGFSGASGRHVHMTNTALTDPEVMEHHYPVRVWRHALREGSGGEGRWRGGDGIEREIEFLSPVTVSFLTQRRTAGPSGSGGGGDGRPGAQWRVLAGGMRERLAGAVSYAATVGERVIIKTPGGGGWGDR